MIHLRVENSSTVRQWTLLRSLVSPPHSASHHANAVARVHASLDGRLCRIIRGGCVCHEVEGRGEACTPLVSGVPRVPDIPCYPKRTAVIPQDLPRATRGRHEAARGVHAGCKTTRGHEGRRGGSGATVLGLTGGERINRIGSPRPWITFEIDARTRSRLGSPPFFTANFGIKSVTLYFVPYFFFCTGLTASFFLSFSRSKTNSSRYSRKRIS